LRPNKRSTVLLGAFALFGCAVPYTEMNPIGGVEHIQMDERTYTVRARGNGYTSTDRVRDYVLLLSAEIAESRNCRGFEVVEARDVTQQYWGKRTGRLTFEFPEMEAVVRLACSDAELSRARCRTQTA
jgi:hypothetical protein